MRGALDVMYTSFARGRPVTVAQEHSVMDQALTEYGCFGHWPDVGPLVRGLRDYSAHLRQTDAEAFAAFDELLDWILEQAPELEEEHS
ncbi:MAG: hypothetical protein DYH12_02970 [Sorangiineae bacterium PRO1]|nr:hypothetical protein [Sorangiineae bacterium PRO1]